MNELVVVDIKAASPGELDAVESAEARLLGLKPADDLMRTEHFLHAGMYVRTLYAPKDVIFAGALVGPDTVMIVSGDLTVTRGDGTVKTLTGYNVLRCAGKRKSLFRTYSDVKMTVIFPTKAETLTDAEREFTDEWDKLKHHEE